VALLRDGELVGVGEQVVEKAGELRAEGRRQKVEGRR
jgi:hypothetical protein